MAGYGRSTTEPTTQIEAEELEMLSARDYDSVTIDAEDVLQSFRPELNSSLHLDPMVRPIAQKECQPIHVPPCPICECDTAIPKFEIEGAPFRLVTCGECHLGMLFPPPTAEQIARFYPEEYYGANGEKFVPLVERAVRWAGSMQARRLTQHLPAGSRVLDIGCGRGTLLSSLADLGFEAHGFDISTTALEGVDPRATVRAAGSLIEAAYPENHFDMVVIWHVLEHLSNPKEVLTEIRRILKPHGELAVAVPNFSSWQARWSQAGWFHLDLPRHLFHFNSENLRQLLEDVGFRCGPARYFSIRQNPFGWVQSFLNRLTSSKRNQLYSMLRRSPPGSKNKAGFCTRVTQRLTYWLGMPFGVLLAMMAALCGRGATVCYLAESVDQTLQSHRQGKEAGEKQLPIEADPLQWSMEQLMF
ncbi:MAG: hypothetical protein Tsb009_08290 [Planctomycetaceae bacterium]